MNYSKMSGTDSTFAMFDDANKFMMNSETVLNNHNTYNAGPHGSGDPYDLSLNEVELRLAIPAIQKKLICDEFCAQENNVYENCKRDSIFTSYFSCSKNKGELNTCINKFLDNSELRQRAINIYIEKRKLFRTLGKNYEQLEKTIEKTEASKE